jgi:hypothetical protein
MIVACVACLLFILAFSLLYAILYRPLYSQPFPGEIVDVISSVSNIRLAELERWVSEEMSDLMGVNAGAILDRVTPRKRGDAAEEN